MDLGASRAESDDRAMLVTAAASRWHWSQVDDAAAQITGDWQLAHVHALVGDGPSSLRFATAALREAVRLGYGGWQLASVHEGVPPAHAAHGATAACRTHLHAAEAALATQSDEEDADAIRAQLDAAPPAARGTA